MSAREPSAERTRIERADIERADLAEIIRELGEVIEERSVRHGEFVLTSGETSHYYVDMKATLLSPRGSRLVGESLYRILAPTDVEAIGGLALGATFVTTAVAVLSEIHGRPIYGFTVRSRPKEHGTGRSVEASYHPDGTLLIRDGRRVAVVDDVVTKGGSILRAVEVVEEAGCRIDAVIALVDRVQGGGERLVERGLPFFSLFEADAEGRLSPAWERAERVIGS
ncbi:MAG: orotate phosphoribosyltransferase [Gemmatimonadota bacterium]|nr:orotate phosphoribosyltransferase [Gemmatimonadota bacterium]